MNPFLEKENDSEKARRRARINQNFWFLLYSGAGLSYSDLMQMDLAEYAEAVEAKLLYNEAVKQQRDGGGGGG